VRGNIKAPKIFSWRKAGEKNRTDRNMGIEFRRYGVSNFLVTSKKQIDTA
jgi:hypothetical protein